MAGRPWAGGWRSSQASKLPRAPYLELIEHALVGRARGVEQLGKLVRLAAPKQRRRAADRGRRGRERRGGHGPEETGLALAVANVVVVVMRLGHSRPPWPRREAPEGSARRGHVSRDDHANPFVQSRVDSWEKNKNERPCKSDPMTFV